MFHFDFLTNCIEEGHTALIFVIGSFEVQRVPFLSLNELDIPFIGENLLAFHNQKFDLECVLNH